MPMKLLEFPHSHYCEKARWALDYKNVKFQARPILPGFHFITVGRIAPNTSVPVLLDEDMVIQGSSEIITFLDKKFPAHQLTPTQPNLCQKSLEIEDQMCEILGKKIRQILYHRLLAYPPFIRHCFTHTMGWPRKLVFSLLYPVLRHKIYQIYVISDEKVQQAKDEFDITLNELGKKLQHRPYLLGDQFSRADLSLASMLSLLVMPPEHPFPWQEIPDRKIKDFCQGYDRHPVAKWVKEMYRLHRSK